MSAEIEIQQAQWKWNLQKETDSMDQIPRFPTI